MTTICKTADNITAINNAHFQLTSTIGGKRIKTLSICCGDDGDTECSVRETLTNARVLKRSRELCFCDFKGKLGSLLTLPLSKIERYAYEIDGKIIDVRIFCDGLPWRIGLEMA